MQRCMQLAVGVALAGMASIPMLHAKSIAAPPATRPALAEQAQADVPITAIVLYSSGVGYFEHAGVVNGNADTELRFKTDQINDILKSLVLEDLDGGRISTVTYPSQDPIAKTLHSFAVDITGNPTLAELFNQLRGAAVTVHLADRQAKGTILGVEKKQLSTGDGDQKDAVTTAVLNIVTSGSIEAIPMDQVRRIELDDVQLQSELTRALQTLAQSRDQDKKPVVIHFKGQGERHVRLGYVVGTPIWKTSYRLLLGDDVDTKKEGPATRPADGHAARLQGWAIVENQTDNDWHNVRLSLVAGRPISFIENLYQPLYVPRPVVEPARYANLRPQTYEGGIGGAMAKGVVRDFKQDEQAGVLSKTQAQSFQELRANSAAAPAPEAASFGVGPMNAARSIVADAAGGELGELFQYTIQSPVSLQRQRSAMIPIVTDDIAAERVSIYNQSVLANHPLNGAYIKNTTGKHLLAGPITVLDHGAYAGDARIDNLPPGQKRFISYGIDLQVRVNTDADADTRTVQAATVSKGVLKLTSKIISTRKYAINNSSDKDKTIIIEDPRRSGWTLVDSDKPIETTDTLYRFRVNVAAGKTAAFTVTEQLVTDQRIALLDSGIDQLVMYARQEGQIDKSVRDALNKAAEMKGQVVDLQQRVKTLREEIAAVGKEQSRMRENMRVVSQQTEYYKHLLDKLSKQEADIEKKQQQVQELTDQAEQKQKELEDYLGKLDLG